MHGFLGSIVGLAVCFCCQSACVAAQDPELLPFDGLQTFSWIGHDQQQGLNPGTGDFLIAFKLNPDKITRANLPDTGIVAKKPFGRQPGYIVGITMTHDLVIYLNSREREKAGEDDHRLVVPGHFTPGVWRCTAVLVQPSRNRVSVFVDGTLARVFNDRTLGNLDNPADFSVGQANLMNHVRFRGRIAWAGLWTFSAGVATDTVARVTQATASGEGAALNTLAGARGSYWRLTASDVGAKDEGANGNELLYMPRQEARRLAATTPAVPTSTPKTLIVDGAHPAADDAGAGAADRPFKTIQRAVAFAEAGDTVLVKAGIYRESVAVSGGRRGLPIRVRADGAAVISGFSELSGWVPAATEGVWTIKGWTGPYKGPIDSSQTDARRMPETLVFMNGAPLDWIDYAEDLIPGSFTIWPREKHHPMDIHVFPRPDDPIEDARMEVTVPERGVSLVDFVEFEGFRLVGCSLHLDGEGCVVRNNTVEWGGLGAYGGNHRVIGNRLLWGANTGLGGGGHSGCLFESNTVAYANWRCYDPNWGGGGAKQIPACIDNIVRGNTFVYNYGAGFWYDAYNFGNIIEYNLCYDNCGHGGVFDEIGFGNTIRYNVIYNNWCRRQNRSGGTGLITAESPDDVVFRNIVFNSERGTGILLRGFSDREGIGSRAGVLDQCVKYPHHYVTAERQQAWLDNYCRYYEGRTVPQTGVKIRENIVFNNHVAQISTARDYSVTNHPKAAVYDFQSDGNLLFNHADSNRIVASGTNAYPLAAWQAISGKDPSSRIVDPYAQPDALPKWATDLFDFNKHRFRAASEIHTLKPDMRDGVQIMIFKARLARASTYRRLEGVDAGLRAWLLETGEGRMLALWRPGGAGLLRVETGERPVTYEDNWLRQKIIQPVDGKTTVFVGPDPVYLIGVPEQVRIDPTFKPKLYGAAGELSLTSATPPLMPDGHLAKWAVVMKAAPLAVLDMPRAVLPDSPRAWGGTNDLAARVFAAWSPAGLSFVAVVSDDSFMPGADAVELFIDGREEWKHFFVEYQPGVLHLRLEPATNGSVRVITPPYSKGNFYAAGKPVAKEVQAAVTVTPQGYTVEGFVPWAPNLFETASLRPNLILRLGLLVHDGDAGKTGLVTMKWHAGRASDFDTSGWVPVATRKAD
jgi:hypothetical protein